MKKTRQESIKDLQTLSSIGKTTAKKLYFLGIKTPKEMLNADPERLYEKLKKKSGGKLDRCVLYQFRGAKQNKPWWECKDKK